MSWRVAVLSLSKKALFEDGLCLNFRWGWTNTCFHAINISLLKENNLHLMPVNMQELLSNSGDSEASKTDAVAPN